MPALRVPQPAPQDGGLSTPPRAGRAPLLWNLLAALCFAAMGVLAHDVARGCDWRLIVLVRSLLGLATVLVVSGGGAARPPAGAAPWLWARSLSGALAQLLTFYALAKLPASDVITLRNTSPIWIAWLARPVLGASSSPGTWAAVLLGVVGVALVEQPRLATLDPATLAAMAASLLVAVAMLSLSRLGEVDHGLVVAHFSAVTAVGAAAVALLWSPAPSLDGLRQAAVWPGLLGVSALGVTAQLAMTRAYGRGPAVSLAVVGLTQVVFAFGLDLALGVRALAATEVLGAALILLPSAWLSRPPPRP